MSTSQEPLGATGCPRCGRPTGGRCGPQGECLACWFDDLTPAERVSVRLGLYGPATKPEDDDVAVLPAIPVYPLEALPKAAQQVVAQSGLPIPLIAGALLAALTGAIGAATTVEVRANWHERAILWIPLLAPTGAGKSPAQALAMAPIRLRHDDDAPLALGDMTLEALARELGASGGAIALDLDELSQFLRGLGEYKRGGGGDRGRFLALWEGAPWSLHRVGSGGGATNKVRVRIGQPTVTIVGGMQPHLCDLLGSERDGMRARWLPHLAEMPDGAAVVPSAALAWSIAVDPLIDVRSRGRRWTLGHQALRAFDHHRREWKAQSRDGESLSVAAALVKADRHLARVALVLAEAELAHPGVGGTIREGVVERAAMIVNYSLDCWRALPEYETLSLSSRDQRLDHAITRLIAYLDQAGGEATRRELMRAHVAGARSAQVLDALLDRYDEMFPGSRATARPKRGGLPTIVVRAPKRREPLHLQTVSPLGDSEGRCGEIAYEQRELDGVTPGDTEGGDTGLGDTDQEDGA